MSDRAQSSPIGAAAPTPAHPTGRAALFSLSSFLASSLLGKAACKPSSVFA